MKTLNVAILLVLLCATSTSAVTLEITEGFTVEHLSLSGSDVFWNLSGDGFYFREEFPLVEGTNACNCPSFRAFISGVVLDELFYVPDPALGTFSNVLLNVMSSLVALPAPLRSEGEMTITGTMQVIHPVSGAPVTFDLIGRGTHFIEWPQANDPNSHIIRAEGLIFSVPEPTTRLLLTAIVVFALLKRRIG